MATLVTATMKYHKCELHSEISNLICTYEPCQGITICSVCAIEHKNHKQFLISFEDMEIKYRQDRLKYLNVQVAATKKHLMEEVMLKSGLDRYIQLETEVKECEKTTKDKINNRIQKDTSQLITLLQQKKKDLPTFITNHFDGGKVSEKVDQIILQLKEQQEIVRTFEKQVRKKKANLENWVTRGLEEMGQLNNQIKIIRDVIFKRRNQLGKQLDNDFKIMQRADQKKLNSDFNTSDLKGKSDEMKYEIIKKITWENQRLQNQLQRTKLRMMRQDQKILLRNHQFVELQNKMHYVQVELAQKKQALKQKQQQKDRQNIKLTEQKKKQLHEFQTMLVKKGVQNYINPQTLNLRGKGITENQLKMIVKQLTTLISLDLSENLIPMQDLGLIFNLQNLKSLKLSFMKMDRNFVSQISHQYKNSLIELHLDSNNINDDNISDIIVLKHLETLSLVDNNITDAGALKISLRLQKIKKLYLSYNKLTYKSVDQLAKNLFLIQELRLARNSIKNKGVHSISANCKDLIQLHVGGCELSKQGAIYLAKGCSKLKRLSIGNNVLQTDAIIELIMYLPDLTLLEISYCELSTQDLDKIRKVSKMNQKLHLVCQQ